MNRYTYTFIVNCPTNGEGIIYRLRIEHTDVILVEHLKTACSLWKTGYHEDIADDLHARFGGFQVMEAVHHGVTILTERGSL